MGIKKLHLIFDNQTAVFFPGQSVTGRILVASSSSVTIRSIRLKFRGEANISWTEKQSRKKRHGTSTTEDMHIQSYNAEEEYFENNLTLVGGEGCQLQLNEGEHIYPFNITLPDQLPSTFNGEHGQVRYTAIVTVDIHWRMNKDIKRTFQVISPLNLNHDPFLAKPKQLEREKFFCCCFCKSGPMTLVASIPYSGFVPGQIMPVTVELDNSSNVEIDAVQINLERHIEFISSRPSRKIKSCKYEFEILTLQGVGSHASKTWMESIKIPNNLMISNLNYCSIITADYVLKVIAIAEGLHSNTDVSMKITMGDIPLAVVQDAPQYSIPAQSLHVNRSLYGQFTTNSTNLIHLTAPVPGFAQQMTPDCHPTCIYTYPKQPMVPAQFTGRHSLCPQQNMQAYNQSQLPYLAGLNIQQQAFNPSCTNDEYQTPSARSVYNSLL